MKKCRCIVYFLSIAVIFSIFSITTFNAKAKSISINNFKTQRILVDSNYLKASLCTEDPKPW